MHPIRNPFENNHCLNPQFDYLHALLRMNGEIDFTRVIIGAAAYLAIVIIGLVMYLAGRRQGD
jgi:hypothetical protein